MAQYSEEEKKDLYKRGRYKFKAPSVQCCAWDDSDWIKFIDAYNGWIGD